MKKAFTLAETLIVLVVIGILAAILLPVARNIVPDRNLMKFKKAHNTLGSAIRELVQSEEYYLNGDLGVKVDGALVDNARYFCETLANVINIKSKNCSDHTEANPYSFDTRLDVGYKMIAGDLGDPDGKYTNQILTIEINQKEADESCKNNLDSGEELVLSDGTVMYQTSPGHHFAWIFAAATQPTNPLYNTRYYGGKSSSGGYAHCDELGFDRIYKVFCIDIDGINKGEDPFGYGIRADGKILTGARAQEWLEKE